MNRQPSPTDQHNRIAPARQVAFRVIRRVFEQGAYADRALHAEAERAQLDSRDHALAMTMAYGTVQRKRTLDHIVDRLSSRASAKLDPPVQTALRLGLFQIAFLSGVADHAAVHQSVELAKQHAQGGAGLVNAVLRRAVKETPDLLAGLDEQTAQEAAIKHSVPDWIAELWWRELGPQDARALLHRINQPPESAIRINSLKADNQLELPVETQPAPDLPEGRIVKASFDVFGSPLFETGLITPQSRGSMQVARSLAPQAGERVLDLCAAPGAKTTHLAALMANRGEVIACEVHSGRAKALAATCRRLGATCVRVLNQDARHLEAGDPYDRVLVDPPCSGLGTLQSRPDLRWQARRQNIEAMAEQQLDLLHSGAEKLKADGALVYSVCTISRAEADGVIERFLEQASGFRLEQSRQLLPHRDGTDGFFIARLRRG